jgi:hypothetical protein
MLFTDRLKNSVQGVFYFPGCASSSLAIAFVASPVGIVFLDICGIERFSIITLFHNLLYFMLDEKSCVIGNTYCVLEAQSRYNDL